MDIFIRLSQPPFLFVRTEGIGTSEKRGGGGGVCFLPPLPIPPQSHTLGRSVVLIPGFLGFPILSNMPALQATCLVRCHSRYFGYEPARLRDTGWKQNATTEHKLGNHCTLPAVLFRQVLTKRPRIAWQLSWICQSPFPTLPENHHSIL